MKLLSCHLRSLTALGLIVVPLAASTAATINWGAPFVISQPLQVSNPPGSTVHIAADFNSAAGAATAGGDDVINGIPFTVVDQNVTGLLTTTIASGPSYNATYHPIATGDQDLDDLLDSHSYIAANPGVAQITIEGLAVGNIYQIQVINVADVRACCAARTYEPDDGLGNFTTGLTLQRGLYQSVIGTFTADGATQSFQLRSLNNLAGNNDPGLSGLVVLNVIPEPGALALAMAGFIIRATCRRRFPSVRH